MELCNHGQPEKMLRVQMQVWLSPESSVHARRGIKLIYKVGNQS